MKVKNNKMMKNIVVSTHDSLCPIKGGGALRTLKIAEEFNRRGHNVTIIAPTDGVNELNGIKVHWLHPPKKQHSQILSSLKFNVRLLRKFLQCIDKTDIFFVHNTIAAATLPLLKIIYPIKFALDITDIHVEYLPVGSRNIIEKILTPFLAKIEYWIIGRADAITVATKAMRNLLINKGINSQKIKVVYDGAEFETIPFQKENDASKTVIHLGMIDRQHGVEVLIRAIPEVIKELPCLKFIFVGGGRELLNMKKLAKNLRVIQNCLFTDYLPCNQAREFLKKSVIGIIPRQDFLPNRIVTTLKLFEYWASRTAVVSSRLEGIEEVAKDMQDILFFEPGNFQDLAKKIIFIAKNELFRANLVENGSINVQRFNWNNLIPQIVDFYLEQFK